jgi:hypothetical protein
VPSFIVSAVGFCLSLLCDPPKIPRDSLLGSSLTPPRTARGPHAALQVHPLTPQGRDAVARIVRCISLRSCSLTHCCLSSYSRRFDLHFMFSFSWLGKDQKWGLYVQRKAYTRSRSSTVRSLWTFPVLRVALGSSKITCASSSATGRCSVPFGTMKNSPSWSVTSRSRS